MKSNPEIPWVRGNEKPVWARIPLLPSPHRGTAGCVTAYKGPLVSDSVLGRPGADDSLCRRQRSRVPSCPRVPSRRQRGRQNKWEMDLWISFSVSWYCHEIDLFTLECMFVSSVYYQELWVFFSKVIWSYKINLQNNSNEWPKSEKDIFRLSFRLECTKKITNNSNSFSFCFYLLNYGMLRLLFGKKKSRNFLKQILNTSCLSSLCKHWRNSNRNPPP